MSIALYIVSIIVNLALLYSIYIAETMLLYSFYNDGVCLTKKRSIVEFISVLGIELASFISGIIVEAFALKERFPEVELDSILIYTLTYANLFIFLCCISFKKGLGVKKTILRMLVALVIYYLISLNFRLISSMAFFCVTESSNINKDALDLTEKEFLINDAISLACSLIMIAYLYFNYYKKHFSVRPRKLDRVFVGLYFVFLLVLLTIFTNVDGSDEDISVSIKEPVIRVMIVLALLVLMIAVPILMIRGRVNAYYKEVNAYQQTFLETELNASKQYKAAQEDTRAFRHDVQNNLSVVAMLMEQGKIEEAQQYLNDMRTEVNALSPKVVTGDEMIDSIVSSKLPKMEEIGIKFDLDGVIDGGLDWKPMDICTVFANLIDNAIEASSKTEEPFIDLAFKKTDHHRLVRASNSCIENVDTDKLMSGEAHVTTKENKSLHGYGVGNIRKTVEKYGGMMRLSCEDKVFTMELILPK